MNDRIGYEFFPDLGTGGIAPPVLTPPSESGDNGTIVYSDATLGLMVGRAGVYAPVVGAAPSMPTSGGVFVNYRETVNDLGDVTGPATIDFLDGGLVKATTTGPTTWSFTNFAPAGQSSSFVLELTNGGSAAQTWPAETKWPGGTPPTLTVAGLDILVFYTSDGGATFRGVLSQADSK